MDCRSIAHLTESYLARELAPTVSAAFEQHLQACAACRARVRDQSQLEVLLRNLPAEPVSPQLVERIRHQVRARTWRQRIGHALPVALATLLSLSVCAWLAVETFIALQDRALWEVLSWLVSMPELTWKHPTEVAAAVADFTPLGGLVFTTLSALSTWRFGSRLLSALRNPAASSVPARL